MFKFLILLINLIVFSHELSKPIGDSIHLESTLSAIEAARLRLLTGSDIQIVDNHASSQFMELIRYGNSTKRSSRLQCFMDLVYFANQLLKQNQIALKGKIGN
jgi:hypothetical protein